LLDNAIHNTFVGFFNNAVLLALIQLLCFNCSVLAALLFTAMIFPIMRLHPILR